MRNLIQTADLTVGEIDEILKTAEDIIRQPGAYADRCRGMKLATLFFEPSTRTRLSFEAAMYELGGQVLGFSSATASSTVKGESVPDTIRVVSCYADIIAMRHPQAGAPMIALTKSLVPIINAGDGGHYHPTQTLTDLLTIHREKGRLDHLTVGFCGDLKYGRTVHSLLEALRRYEGNKFVLICPESLNLPAYVMEELEEHEYVCCSSLEEAMPMLDILYMTRVQKERFKSEADYDAVKNLYILDPDRMKLGKKDLCVLHPLPRVNEISVAVDDDPRACYFKQVENGKYVRMALILFLLARRRENDSRRFAKEDLIYHKVCTKSNCITSTTQEVQHIFKKVGKNRCRCIYCEAEQPLFEQ